MNAIGAVILAEFFLDTEWMRFLFILSMSIAFSIIFPPASEKKVEKE